jgi:hypothetical protein
MIFSSDFFEILFEKYRRKNQCQKFSFRKIGEKSFCSTIYTRECIVRGRHKWQEPFGQITAVPLYKKKMNFLWNLKAKKLCFFLRNFREWNVWRSWSKDNLIEKELSETKAKKWFSDRIWNVLRSQTGKSKYTGSAETAPGP